jgi:hypothetical protein
MNRLLKQIKNGLNFFTFPYFFMHSRVTINKKNKKMKALYNHETFKPSDLGKEIFFEETKKMRRKKKR